MPPNPPLEPTAEKRGGSAANRWALPKNERSKTSQHGRLCFLAQQTCFHHCACGLFDGCCGGAVFLRSRTPMAASKLKSCRTNRWTQAAGACLVTNLVRRKVL